MAFAAISSRRERFNAGAGLLEPAKVDVIHGDAAGVEPHPLYSNASPDAAHHGTVEVSRKAGPACRSLCAFGSHMRLRTFKQGGLRLVVPQERFAQIAFCVQRKAATRLAELSATQTGLPHIAEKRGFATKTLSFSRPRGRRQERPAQTSGRRRTHDGLLAADKGKPPARGPVSLRSGPSRICTRSLRNPSGSRRRPTPSAIAPPPPPKEPDSSG